MILDLIHYVAYIFITSEYNDSILCLQCSWRHSSSFHDQLIAHIRRLSFSRLFVCLPSSTSKEPILPHPFWLRLDSLVKWLQSRVTTATLKDSLSRWGKQTDRLE